MTTATAAQRVGILIDVQNIYHSAKHLHAARVNFQELIKMIVGNRSLVRALAYVVKSEGVVPDSEVRGEASFFEALKQAGLELRLKGLQVYAGGAKKADWDVGLAVDAIRLAPSLDTLILVTGDGDFIPLVEYLKWGLGKQVEVAAFGKATSGRLREVADRFFDLDAVPRILMKIRGQREIRRQTPHRGGVRARASRHRFGNRTRTQTQIAK